MSGIQLFVPTFEIDACLEQIRECLETGWTGLGFKTVAFEDAWKEYSGHGHAHFLGSATFGLHLAIKILKDTGGWADGDEVISTPLTFVSTNHAIVYENLKVVFADVGDDFCLDPEDVARKITPRTRAIVFVGIGGNTGHWPEICSLAERHGLKLILDAAHMAGTRLHGEAPGLQADAAVYSFQAVKNLPTADSGMVCFRDSAHDVKARKLSWMGINKDTYTRTLSEGKYKWRYDLEWVGYKYHGNSIMAAIGLAQLPVLDRDNAYRRQIAAWYDGFFSEHPDTIRPVPVADGCESSRHLYAIEVAARDELILALNSNGIFPGVHYRDNTEYPQYSYAQGTCPRAQLASRQALSLPIHLRLTYEDVRRVARCVMENA